MRRRPLTNLLGLVIILLAAWLIVESPLFHKTAPTGQTPSTVKTASPDQTLAPGKTVSSGPELTDLHSVGQFQALFNADTGMTRLILIFSPT